MKEVINFAQAYEIADQIAKIEIESEKVNAETKRELYITLFDNLKKNGVEEDRIVSEAHKLIEEALQSKKKDTLVKFNNDSWFYDVARKEGYGSSAEPLEQNTSTITKELEGECIKERKEIIQFCIDNITDWVELKNIFTEKEIQDDSGNKIIIEYSKFFDSPEFTLNFKSLGDLFYADRELWRQQRDSRQSILPMMRLPVLALTSIITNKWLCAKYYAIVKTITEITPKKLSQYIKDNKSLSDLLKWVGLDAWRWNFIDVCCPQCDSPLKTQMKEDYTWVFVCKNWQAHTKDTWTKEQIEQRKKEGTIYDGKFDLLHQRISQLTTNRGGSADNYLKKKSIEITEN